MKSSLFIVNLLFETCFDPTLANEIVALDGTIALFEEAETLTLGTESGITRFSVACLFKRHLAVLSHMYWDLISGWGLFRLWADHNHWCIMLQHGIHYLKSELLIFPIVNDLLKQAPASHLHREFNRALYFCSAYPFFFLGHKPYPHFVSQNNICLLLFLSFLFFFFPCTKHTCMYT